jgi:hypothetical protein
MKELIPLRTLNNKIRESKWRERAKYGRDQELRRRKIRKVVETEVVIEIGDHLEGEIVIGEIVEEIGEVVVEVTDHGEEDVIGADNYNKKLK